MRPKFVIILLSVAGLIILLALLAKQQLQQSPKPIPAPAMAIDVAVPAPVPKQLSAPELPPAVLVQTPLPVKSDPVPVAELSQERQDSMVAAEITQINAVIGKSDPDSMALILSYLTNSEPQLRELAVAAVKQSGDRSIIPALTNLAMTIDDYEQRHAVMDAANFLALPSINEALPDLMPVRTISGGQSSVRQNGPRF